MKDSNTKPQGAFRGEIRSVSDNSLDDLVDRLKAIRASGEVNDQAKKLLGSGGTNSYDVAGHRGPVIMTGAIMSIGKLGSDREKGKK